MRISHSLLRHQALEALHGLSHLLCLGDEVAFRRVDVAPLETVHVVLVHPPFLLVPWVEIDEDEHLTELCVCFWFFVFLVIFGQHLWHTVQLLHPQMILVHAISSAALLDSLSDLLYQDWSVLGLDVVFIE